MKLSIFDKERWFEVRDARRGDSKSERTLGDALETAINWALRWETAAEIWQCEGNSSYTSTLLLDVRTAKEGNGVLITGRIDK